MHRICEMNDGPCFIRAHRFSEDATQHLRRVWDLGGKVLVVKARWTFDSSKSGKVLRRPALESSEVEYHEVMREWRYANFCRWTGLDYSTHDHVPQHHNSQSPFARRRLYDGPPLFRSRPTADAEGKKTESALQPAPGVLAPMITNTEGDKTESTLHFAPDVLAPTITKRSQPGASESLI